MQGGTFGSSKKQLIPEIAQNEAVKEGTLSFKAGQVALKGLALGANILATYLVTKLITAYSDYKNKIHEVAQEATEQAEKSSGYVENLIKLQSELQNGTKSSDELTTAFKEQLQTMGYTESEIDTLISKYNGLSGAISATTEEALKDAKTDAYTEVASSSKALELDSRGGFFDSIMVSRQTTGIKELDDQINKLMSDSAKLNADGGKYWTPKDNSAEGLYDYYNTLKEVSELIQETASTTNNNDLLNQGNLVKTTVYGTVTDAIDKMKESAEQYGNAMERINSIEAQTEFADYLKKNDINNQEAFDSYIYNIKTSDDYSKSYKNTLIDIANNAFPQFANASKQTSDSLKEVSDAEKSLSFESQLSQIQSLKTGFDQLKSIYDDVENAGTFDFSSIIGNTDFQTAFGKYTEEYENFIQTISNSPNDIQKCQDAFNQLATAYIYNSDALKSLDGSVASTSAAINMLSSMGVSNAQEIVNHVIAAKNAYRELAVAVGETTYSTENLEEATISDMYALLNEGDMADKTKNQILAYYLQKQSAAGLQFSSEADCEQLKAIVSVLGVASSAWDTYYEHKQNIEKFTKKAENANSSKAKKSAEKWAYLSALEADKELTQMKADIAKITSNVSYAPSVKYTSPTKINNTAKDSAKDAERTAKDTEKEIEDLVDKFMDYMEKSLDAGKIDYQTYCNFVKGYLDDLYKQGKISASKYFSSVEKMLQKQKDIYDRALSAITKRYDDEIKKIEESIQALNKKNDSLNKEKDKYDSILSAINDVYDTEIKRLQDQQDAIQDSIDKLNDENDALDLQKRKEQALYNLRKAQNQNTKRLYVEGRGWIYDTDRQAIADANKEYQDIKTEELIDKLQKEKDAIDSSIDKLNEMKEKWNEVANAYEKSVNRQNTALYFGSEYEKRILSNNINDVSVFRDKYISIQSQINSNEELIKSYEEKKEYYSKLKEEWSNISTTLEEQRDRQYVAQLLGANWEKDILDGRLDVLNNFKKQYIQIQNDMAEAARQAAAAELNSPSGSTSGGSGSGGYSGGSSGGYTGGGGIGGGNSGGTKSNPAIVRFQRMCKETLGGNVDITGVKDTKTTNAIKYLQAMLSNDRRIGLRGYSSGMWDRKTFDAMWKWLNRPANKKHKDWITNNIGGLPAPTFEHGGLIKRNISDSSTINQLGGENALIYAREGERVLTQNQNRQWEKWTDAMPQLMETLTNLQTDYSIPKPNYSTQLGNSIQTMKQDVNITQHITVTLPNVTNDGGYENLTKFLDGLYADSIQYSNRRK